MNTYPYEYTHVHSIHTSERLSQFDLEIHEVDHKERLTVDGDITLH
jgi:hypothetical protein